MKSILVAGGRGVTGRATVSHFEKLGDWEVTGISRSAPDFETSAKWITCDLQDEQACREALSKTGGFTRIAFCALSEKDDMVTGWSESEHTDLNLAMLRNVVTAAEAVSPDLEHVAAMQGAKYYGKHMGPHRNPARESDARYMYPNFYYAQEDWLIERSQQSGWGWTGFRPQSVWTSNYGGTANFIIAVGVYAAISRELGIPLRYPGLRDHIYEASDAELIAEAVAWAGDTPEAAGEAFNITNGDIFVTENLWPLLADVFDMPLGHPQAFILDRIMPAHSAVWDSIVKKYDLVPLKLETIMPNWQYIDFAMGTVMNQEPSLLSTIKLRKYGFHECVDTEDRFVELLREAQEKRFLPR